MNHSVAVAVPPPHADMISIHFALQAYTPARLGPIVYEYVTKRSKVSITEKSDGRSIVLPTHRNREATMTTSGFTINVLLTTYDMSICSFKEVASLPDLSQLRRLTKLSLSNMNLTVLPSLSSLVSLDSLTIFRLLIKVLPLGICEAPRLTSLIVHYCDELNVIPADFFTHSLEGSAPVGLTRLVVMNVACEMPVEVSNLKTLKYLVADNFSAEVISRGIPFQGVEEVAFVGHLRASAVFNMNACSLRNMVRLSFQNLPMMTIPCLLECSNLLEVTLEKLPILRLPIGVAEAPRLMHLQIRDCAELEAIDVAFIRRLCLVTADSPDPLRFKILLVEALPCPIPDEINELLGLESLVMKDSAGPYSPTVFPDISRTLTALKTLAVISCDEYDVLPEDFSGLSSLTKLKLKKLNIEHIPNSIAKLYTLKILKLHKLVVRQMPMDLSTLTNLETLKISQCHYLHNVNMNFWRCPKLVNISLRKDSDARYSIGPDTKFFGKVAQIIPMMRDLQTLSIKGNTPADFEAIAEALQAWPLSRVTVLDFDRLLRPSGPGDPIDDNDEDAPVHRAQKINNENLRIIRDWSNTQEKVMAFSMAMHSRVGAASPAHVLEGLTMSTVIDLVMGRTAYVKKWEASFAMIDGIKSLQTFNDILNTASADEDGEEDEYDEYEEDDEDEDYEDYDEEASDDGDNLDDMNE